MRTIPPEKFSFACFHCKKTLISYRFSNYVGYPPPWKILPENPPTLSEKLFPPNLPPWGIYPVEVPPPHLKPLQRIPLKIYPGTSLHDKFNSRGQNTTNNNNFVNKFWQIPSM